MSARRVSPWLPALLAAALAVLYLAWDPLAPDLAAQVYRADLFARQGYTLWDGQWFGGFHTLGYSILFPPLAALLTPELLGGLAALASAVAFDRIARARWGTGAWLGSVWFAASTATNLLIGRLTFAIGVAVGVGAVLAAQRGRTAVALALGLLCPLASPVAGLFLALAGVAGAIAGRWRVGLGLAAAALAPALVLTVAFPGAGRQTFDAITFWPLIAYSAGVLILVPRREQALRAGAAVYALAVIAAYLVDTPMGSNIARLGTTFGPALAACALWPRGGWRRWSLVALAAPLLYWQWTPTYNDLSKASDASVHAGYYAPLLGFLAAHPGPPGRVEVVPTRTHWEVVYVAPRFALARGWERQLDTRYAPLFYQPHLRAVTYHRWLDQLAVRFVALPDAPHDFAARKEARRVEHPPAYLRLVWRSAHWRVFAVSRPAPLADGAATATKLSERSVELRATSAGVALVRVRWSPYWAVTSGSGCVERAPHDLVRLRLRRAGPVRLAIRFAPWRLLARGPRCSG